MAWSLPMTFTPDTPLTAAQLNTNLRDNLLQTEASRRAFTNTHGLYAALGPNSIANRQVAEGVAGASITTTSTTPVALTGGPSVTFAHGGAFLVIIEARIRISSGSGIANMSFEVTGSAGQAGPSIVRAIRSQKTTRTNLTAHVIHFNIPTSSNTVVARYWTSGGTAEFWQRRLMVIPF